MENDKNLAKNLYITKANDDHVTIYIYPENRPKQITKS
jgi:hypothetical protein